MCLLRVGGGIHLRECRYFYNNGKKREKNEKRTKIKEIGFSSFRLSDRTILLNVNKFLRIINKQSRS